MFSSKRLETTLFGVILGSILISQQYTVQASDILADSGNYRTYGNPDYDFLVKYPENWTANETANEIFNITNGVILEPIPSEAQQAGFFVGETQKTATAFADFIRSLEEIVTDPVFVNSSLTTLSELPAISFTYYQDLVGDDAKVMNIYLESGDRAFSLQYIADPEYFDDYLPVAKSIIDSFQITPRNATNIT